MGRPSETASSHVVLFAGKCTTSQSWKDYVNYIDSMVLNEFDQFIRKSLNYLMDNMVADVSDRREIYVHAYTYICIINMR